MKKISLKSIKEGLSRSEMRSIMGGSGSGACSDVNKDCSWSSCPSSCTCTSITMNGQTVAKVCR